MLTVAVSRLRELWPRAEIAVITNAPDRIARQCHAVTTVPVRGRRLLLENRALGPARRWLPEGIAEPWDRSSASFCCGGRDSSGASLALKAALGGRSSADANAFLDAIDRADLVVVNGAGVITDAFRGQRAGHSDDPRSRNARGIPTALLGQGLGPIDDPVLWQRAAEVLPGVGIIAVRESQTSVPLLASLGVRPDKVRGTGDDAVELAFSASRARTDVPVQPCPQDRRQRAGSKLRRCGERKYWSDLRAGADRGGGRPRRLDDAGTDRPPRRADGRRHAARAPGGLGEPTAARRSRLHNS